MYGENIVEEKEKKMVLTVNRDRLAVLLVNMDKSPGPSA